MVDARHIASKIVMILEGYSRAAMATRKMLAESSSLACTPLCTSLAMGFPTWHLLLSPATRPRHSPHSRAWPPRRAPFSLLDAAQTAEAVVVVVAPGRWQRRSEEHTSELQSLAYLVCRLLLEKKK